MTVLGMQGCSRYFLSDLGKQIDNSVIHRDDPMAAANQEFEAAQNYIKKGKAWLAYPLLTNIQTSNYISDSKKAKAATLLQRYRAEIDEHLQEM